MVGFDPSALRTHEQYKLLTGTVTPRPIALVTTLGEKGLNAAPFSFFNAIGVKPPMGQMHVRCRYRNAGNGNARPVDIVSSRCRVEIAFRNGQGGQ